MRRRARRAGDVRRVLMVLAVLRVRVLREPNVLRVLRSGRGAGRISRRVVAMLALSILRTFSTSTLSTLSTFSTFSTTLFAQPSSVRLATTPEALIAAPVFFHGKQIVVRRDVETAGTLMRLANTAKPIFVLWRESGGMGHDSEVRGEFWDLGRLDRADPRFSNVNFQPILDAA